MKRNLIRVGLSAAAALLAAELALHLFPALLPRSYLAHYPGNGTEFFHPDVFERTPVEGVLLPHLAATYRGSPPADLIELGVAPRSADDDARAFPDLELPADALGFPNAPRPDGRDGERRELVLVGDSFGVSAGATRPEGLASALERATGLAVHNLSLGGIGPAQERWLIDSLALAKQPRAVLWLYYSGNDLTASYEPFVARRDGHATWAEAWPERRKPSLYLTDLIAKCVGSSVSGASPDGGEREPLPGFSFARADGNAQPVWFEPDTLRQLGWSREEWEAHPVWGAAQGELRAARDACAAAGARFLLVYLPSKPEVLLPFVTRDPELAQRTIAFLGNPAPPLAAEALYDLLLANRHAHEELLRAFCTAESIPFLSATPELEAQAARGELGFLVADTHWQTQGQGALLEPLLAFLRAQGLLD